MTAAPAPRWLLDTHILAEPLRPRPDAAVMQRLRAHEPELCLPVTVWQELTYGWLRMPQGHRRERVGQYLQTSVARLPMVALDASAARIQAELRWQADQAGRPISYPDSEIAAMAIAHGLTLVTRNLRDFEGRAGLQLVNWFNS